MAVSAYNEKGLLKKNPLLGTSLAVDQNRGTEREKFGKLHEKAMDFQGTKEEFQASQQGEYNEKRDTGLAAFAKSQSDLTATKSKIADYRTKMRDLSIQKAKAEEMGGLISGGNWKKMNAFENANPEIAKAAGEHWESLGAKTRKETYYKGKRSRDVHEKYRALGADIEDQENILNESMPELLEQLAAIQGGTPGDNNDSYRMDNLEDFGKQALQSIGNIYGPTVGNLLNVSGWENNPTRNAMAMTGLPLYELSKGDLSGAMKTGFMSAIDPVGLLSLGKSLFGLGSKKEKRKANRRMRAGGRMGAYMDELGLQSGRAGLETVQSQLGLATSSLTAAGQQQTVASQRKTLEDQANFYGSFFS